MKFNASPKFTYLGLDFERRGVDRSVIFVSQKNYIMSMITDFNISKKKLYPANLLLFRAAERCYSISEPSDETYISGQADSS